MPELLDPLLHVHHEVVSLEVLRSPLHLRAAGDAVLHINQFEFESWREANPNVDLRLHEDARGRLRGLLDGKYSLLTPYVFRSTCYLNSANFCYSP